jgi:multidrug efflux pump subunit AcrA (membrane-fusion protein)
MDNHTTTQDNMKSAEEQIRASLKKKLIKRRIKRIIGWLVFLVIIAAAVYSYSYYKTNGSLPFLGTSKKASTAAANAAPVEVTVRQLQFSQVIDISGSVEAYQTQKVVFRSTGAVTGVFVKEGDRVVKGQLLATIDDTSQSYNLRNIESQIEQAKLEGSVRQLELLEMQRTMSRNNLDYTKAYANFDGVVASVKASQGDYFSAGDVAMVVIDRSKLKATVEIDEIDIQNVHTGMKALLTFDSVEGKTVESSVTYIPMIGRTTNQGIGVLDVEITIGSPPAAVSPGFTFAGTITSEEPKTMLVVSTSAVTTARGVSTVRKKAADGNPVPVTVTTKYLGEGMSEILTGDIKAGDVLLVTGATSASIFGINIPGMTAVPSSIPAGVVPGSGAGRQGGAAPTGATPAR